MSYDRHRLDLEIATNYAQLKPNQSQEKKRKTTMNLSVICAFSGKLISFFTKLQLDELRCLATTPHTPPAPRLRLL